MSARPSPRLPFATRMDRVLSEMDALGAWALDGSVVIVREPHQVARLAAEHVTMSARAG